MKKKVETIKTGVNKIAIGIFLLIMPILYCPKQLFASGFPEVQQQNDKKVTLNVKDKTLVSILSEIKRQTGFAYGFRDDRNAISNEHFSIQVKNVSVDSALTVLLNGSKYSYQIEGELILIGIKKSQTESDQQSTISIKGAVVDEKGNPIAGATVLILGTTRGTASDENGRFTLNVKPDDVLKITFIGYEDEVFPVKGRSRANITMNPTEENLEEVTVVAFGEQKKESVVGSITTVRPMDLKTSSSDFTAGLVGRVSGLIGYKQSGLPVALTEEELNNKIVIRGITSFQRGANSSPLILLDGVECSMLDLSRIAPEDMESFSVMKDASATAMYGARGANGVILVTTKKGAEGSVYTTARYEMVVTQPTKEIEVADPIEYMRYYNQALIGRSNSATPKYSVERINRTASGKYPSWVYPANDWYDILFKDFSVNHYAGATIRGGSRVVQYYSSLAYNYDQGMLKTDRLNQFNCNIRNHQIAFRTNLNIDLHAGIKLVINSSATLDRYNGPLIDTQSAYSLAFNASPVDFAPTYPGDMKYGWPHLRFGTTSAGPTVDVNPYALLQQGYKKRIRYSTINKAEYIQNLSVLVKGLELRLSASLVQSGLYDQGYTTAPYYYSLPEGNYDFETGEHTLVADGRNAGSSRTLSVGSSGSSTDTRLTFEGRLYHTAAWGDHQTSLTGVCQLYERTFNPITEVLNGMPQRNLNYSARASYGYKNRYFIEASGAYNGSERFAKGNRMGFFPAVGGAWVASSEKWMEPVAKVLSYLKFRFSYGKVGNDGVIDEPRYVYIPKLGTIQSKGMSAVAMNQERIDLPPYSSQRFSRKAVVTYANDNIQWEVAESMNFGIETKFFRDLIEIQADIYQEIRHNIISQRVIVPASMGIEVPQLDNIGSTRSRGVDFSGKLQYMFDKDFGFILNGTLTYNKVIYRDIEEAIGTQPWQRKKGREISQAIGYIAEGLFRDQAEIDNSPSQEGDVKPGDIRYRDLNGDNKIDINDVTFIGYPEEPRLIYGFSGYLTYKNIEFSFSFQGSGKRTFFMDPMALSPFVNNHAMLKEIADDHWSDDNMAKKPFWPRLSNQAISAHNPQERWNDSDVEVRKSTYFMRECSFLRCTAITLAYSLPRRWLDKLKLQNVKLAISTNNPFCITDFKIWDVELGKNGFNYPIQKTYSVGLNVSF
ncbi:TonB-dependent receptor [Butyricimonas sp. Marseille-P3923]|uniref:TonB-dependent receptor n=1 Tax=Butyricimonas TaxID=574697 RepID=UPI000C088604|nr:TonB-dependent receptor [Butyricimonas sp. Marseille-P3923]